MELHMIKYKLHHIAFVTFLMLETGYSGVGVNMSVDTLEPKVAGASPDMVLAV